MPSSRNVAQAWMRLHVAKKPSGQLSQFRQEVEGRKFRNPDTGNEVQFVSLPKSEQAKIFAQWRRQQRGDEPRKERERGLIKVDKEDARERAKHIADTARKWLVRDPDERIGDRFTPGMGRGYITMGTLDITDVRGRKFERPLRLTVGKPNPELWKADRKYTTGGRVVTRQTGENDPGMPMYVQVDLNPDRTYKEMADGADKLEREIYSILIHEMTHAQDVLMTQRDLKRHKDKHTVPEDTPNSLRTEAENREYYNKPTEVRAFKQQVSDEVRSELERMYEDEDDADWISMDSEAVMEMLGKSTTWSRVKGYLSRPNKRKFLETVASVVRKFKEDKGGKVAARKVAAAWLRQAISEKHVKRLRKKVKVDDLPFDHLFEGKRRLVVDPKEHGGLGAREPDSADKLEKFMRDNGAFVEGDKIDWQSGLLLDAKGKTKSKVGKAISKAIKKFVGNDREFFSNMEKVRKGLTKAESPMRLTLGTGRDNLRALAGMGHLLVKDFPTKEVWSELERYDNVPSPKTWKRIREVADAFSKLTPEELIKVRDEHEREYEAYESDKKVPVGFPKSIPEDVRRQYWDARGLFQTHAKARGDKEREWIMKHFQGWADRTDEFYESEDSAPVREMHEQGAKMSPDRFEELKGLSEVEQHQQDYALWRSIAGEDLAVVLSRDPIDVLRMSDHPKAVQAIQSCHSEGGSEFQCAIEEAEEGGLIAYVVKKSDVEGRDLEEGELFEDQGRGIEGIKPFARLRLRRFESGEGTYGHEVAVPETTTYGADFPDFVQAVTNWAREEQPEFYIGDAGYSKRPSDWRLTGGTYQDSESSELFNNFFNRGDDEEYGDEPSEDEYDPYGEGYTADDSPYYDPDREDEDEGEAEVSEKSVQPWRDTDRDPDFWTWMEKNHPEVRNPNRRGKKDYISPSTLKGYARGGAGYSGAARDTVRQFQTRYREERKQYAEARARGDIRASRVAAVWLQGRVKATRRATT